MKDKIIIDRMDAEEFLEMLKDAAEAAKHSNPNRYYSTEQIIKNIAADFKDLCKM